MEKSVRKLVGITILAIASRSTPATAQSPNTPQSAIHISGSGAKTYVLISGLMCGVAGFRRLETVLVEQGNRVIIIDPYRLSEDSADLSFMALARRVDRVLEKNRVHSARVVGHAPGGGVALRLAALNSSRVTELYLLDVGALPRRKPLCSPHRSDLCQ